MKRELHRSGPAYFFIMWVVSLLRTPKIGTAVRCSQDGGAPETDFVAIDCTLLHSTGYRDNSAVLTWFHLVQRRSVSNFRVFRLRRNSTLSLGHWRWTSIRVSAVATQQVGFVAIAYDSCFREAFREISSRSMGALPFKVGATAPNEPCIVAIACRTDQKSRAPRLRHCSHSG